MEALAAFGIGSIILGLILAFMVGLILYDRVVIITVTILLGIVFVLLSYSIGHIVLMNINPAVITTPR